MCKEKLNIELYEIERNKLDLSGVTPHVAFFVVTSAMFPEYYLHADEERGGFTERENNSITEEIRSGLSSILDRVLVNEPINTLSNEYLESISRALSEGTCGVGLSESEKYLMDRFLRNNGCDLDPFALNLISTDMVV